MFCEYYYFFRQKKKRLLKKRSPLGRQRTSPPSSVGHALCFPLLLCVIFAATTQSVPPRIAPTTSYATSAASPDMSGPAARLSEPSVSHTSNQGFPEFPSQDLPARDWEFEQSTRLHSEPIPPGVQGKLKSCLPYWKNELKATNFVIDTIEHGYKIPFSHVPPQFYARNNKSSLNHSEFVESAIADLLVKRCAIEVASRPHCCNPLTVSEGKKTAFGFRSTSPESICYEIQV